MKRLIALGCVLLAVVPVWAQESDVTYETTTTTSVGGANLTSELWFMDDATPLTTGQTDLRLTFGWVTASAPANMGDSNDDFVLTPSLVWGTCSNVEAFVTVPVWLGDGGDAGALEEGNADTFAGFTWRLSEPDGGWPALAIKATGRIPTGDGSNGFDAELRLIMTNEYDSGIRSHINAFAETVHTDNDQNLRHFQWGFVFGMDGPLCGDGAVRWVADYLHRSSHHFGAKNMNMLETGWEWTISDVNKLGMSLQIGLDGRDDTPNFGAALTYAYSLTY